MKVLRIPSNKININKRNIKIAFIGYQPEKKIRLSKASTGDVNRNQCPISLSKGSIENMFWSQNAWVWMPALSVSACVTPDDLFNCYLRDGLFSRLIIGLRNSCMRTDLYIRNYLFFFLYINKAFIHKRGHTSNIYLKE